MEIDREPLPVRMEGAKLTPTSAYFIDLACFQWLLTASI
jgi:hypothetical protein